MPARLSSWLPGWATLLQSVLSSAPPTSISPRLERRLLYSVLTAADKARKDLKEDDEQDIREDDEVIELLEQKMAATAAPKARPRPKARIVLLMMLLRKKGSVTRQIISKIPFKLFVALVANMGHSSSTKSPTLTLHHLSSDRTAPTASHSALSLSLSLSFSLSFSLCLSFSSRCSLSSFARWRSFLRALYLASSCFKA